MIELSAASTFRTRGKELILTGIMASITSSVGLIDHGTRCVRYYLTFPCTALAEAQSHHTIRGFACLFLGILSSNNSDLIHSTHISCTSIKFSAIFKSCVRSELWASRTPRLDNASDWATLLSRSLIVQQLWELQILLRDKVALLTRLREIILVSQPVSNVRVA